MRYRQPETDYKQNTVMYSGAVIKCGEEILHTLFSFSFRVINIFSYATKIINSMEEFDMKKELGVVIGSLVIGIGVGSLIKAKEYMDTNIRGINKAWEAQLDKAYEHIEKLNGLLDDQQEFIERIMQDEKEHIEIIKRLNESES